MKPFYQTHICWGTPGTVPDGDAGAKPALSSVSFVVVVVSRSTIFKITGPKYSMFWYREYHLNVTTRGLNVAFGVGKRISTNIIFLGSDEFTWIGGVFTELRIPSQGTFGCLSDLM